MNNHQSWNVITLFLLLIFGFTIATILKPQRSFSERENRVLATRPAPTVSTILSGSFEKDYEDSLTDQFVLRDQWIALRSAVEKLVQKKDIHDVYLGKDGYLIEKHTDTFTTGHALENVEHLKNFAAQAASRYGTEHVAVMVVPNAVDILKEKLPPFADPYDEEEYLARIETSLPKGVWIGVSDVLRKAAQSSGQQLYYRTDHHWQCFGSYRGYRDVFALLRLAEQGEQINSPVKVPDASLGIDGEERVTDEEGNQAVLVSRFYHDSKARSTGTPKQFLGYMYAYQFHYVPMQITRDGESYQYGDDEKYLHNKEVWIEDGIRYGLMYGRDEGELIFDTGRRERPNILVMGDSFDNAVLRLLAGHYNQLHSIDLRHYETQKGHAFNMSEYIRKNDISTVLFLGNNGLFMAVRFTKF